MQSINTRNNTASLFASERIKARLYDALESTKFNAKTRNDTEKIDQQIKEAGKKMHTQWTEMEEYIQNIVRRKGAKQR